MKPLILITIVSALLTSAGRAHAQGAAFTYQGLLRDTNGPVTNTVSIQFRLYAAPSGGASLWQETHPSIPVTNGLFVATLGQTTPADETVFIGSARWLGISVNGSPELTPRHQVTPTPYAITAGHLTGVVPSSGLTGTYSAPVTFNNGGNSFSGNGAGLAALDASSLASGTVADARLAGNVARTNQVWLLGGNSGTTPGTHFLGTTDNQPLEIKVNGLRALRIEDNGDSIFEPGTTPDGAPNLIGGSPRNFVGAGAVGVTIAGGGATNYNGVAYTNWVWSDFGVVGGGGGNSIGDGSDSSAIGGGSDNNIADNSRFATIAGGVRNDIGINAEYSSIGGGQYNHIASSSQGATIAGGQGNDIGASSCYSAIGAGINNSIASNSPSATIAGGVRNDIGASSSDGTIGGGSDNTIAPRSQFSTIAGGGQNAIGTNSSYSAIGGGTGNTIANGFAINATIAGGGGNDIGASSSYGTIGGGSDNTIGANSAYATIPGGDSNFATNRAFAAGTLAKANHTGAFVWADSQDADFASTGTNQFLIRASGGVGVNVAQPRGKLRVGTSSNVAPISLASHTIIIDNANENGRAAFLALAGPGGSTATNRVELELEANEGQRLGIIGTTSNHEVQFRQNNVTRMRFATNGNIGINLSNPAEQLHVSGNILATGTITPNSDRNAKTDVKPVDPSAILERVARLPIQQWRFKAESEQVKHVGPMAQDFRGAFGLGAHETAIATVDADGVALAAIQGLNEKVEVRSERAEGRIQKLEAENTELKTRLERLERLFGSLEQASTAK